MCLLFVWYNQLSTKTFIRKYEKSDDCRFKIWCKNLYQESDQKYLFLFWLVFLIFFISKES